MKAVVNKIIKNTFIDGPGCRLAVFFQGCNMSCLYCHNPETQKLCSGCGKCSDTCPAGALSLINGKIVYDAEKCKACDLCLKTCPGFSSPKCTEMSIGELYQIITPWTDFLDGVTVSGGECTLQHEFVYELFEKLKANTGLTCFVDTNGCMDPDVMEKLCGIADGFMFDLKSYDREAHIRLTGADNGIIFDNLETASAKRLLYEVRTVVVRGFTDSRDEIRNICEYIKGLNNYTLFKLISFRPQGVRTYLAEAGCISRGEYESLYELAYSILGDRTQKIVVLG